MMWHFLILCVGSCVSVFYPRIWKWSPCQKRLSGISLKETATWFSLYVCLDIPYSAFSFGDALVIRLPNWPIGFEHKPLALALCVWWNVKMILLAPEYSKSKNYFSLLCLRLCTFVCVRVCNSGRAGECSLHGHPLLDREQLLSGWAGCRGHLRDTAGWMFGREPSATPGGSGLRISQVQRLF